jgi:hypothetical protein
MSIKVNQLKFEDVKSYIFKNNCILLSEEYINKKRKLIIQFECGDIKEMSFECFERGQRCSCSSTNRFKSTIERKTRDKIIKILSTSNITLISFENNICSWNGRLIYECEKGHIINQGIREFMRGKSCKQCSFEKSSVNQKRNKGNNWQGGKTNLRKYMKKKLIEWKKESMKNCNYKCIITGRRFNDIHHLYPFNLILDEALNSLEIDYKKIIGDYPEGQLKEIENKINYLHTLYPLGVCLTKEVHQNFHKIYGNKNFTIEDFYKFKNNYIN